TEILIARRYRIIMNFRDATFINGLLKSIGQSFAISALIVDDSNFFVFKVLQVVIGHHVGLLVVTSTSAKNGFKTTCGQIGPSGRWRNHQDTVFSKNVRNGNCNARGYRTDNEFDAITNQLVGCGNTLLWFTCVVSEL